MCFTGSKGRERKKETRTLLTTADDTHLYYTDTHRAGFPSMLVCCGSGSNLLCEGDLLLWNSPCLCTDILGQNQMMWPLPFFVLKWRLVSHRESVIVR